MVGTCKLPSATPDDVRYRFEWARTAGEARKLNYTIRVDTAFRSSVVDVTRFNPHDVTSRVDVPMPYSFADWAVLVSVHTHAACLLVLHCVLLGLIQPCSAFAASLRRQVFIARKDLASVAPSMERRFQLTIRRLLVPSV